MATGPYDAFEHLCLSLFSLGHDLFAMLTGYFDDTNSDPRSPVPMVAGYLASGLRWTWFNKQWAKVLRRHKVPIDPNLEQRISHRSKMVPDNTLFGPWVKAHHREPFLEEASRIIRRHIIMPIGNAVYRKDFDEIVPKSFAKQIGGAYGWCVYSTMYAIRGYCEKYKLKDPIRIVFEETRGQGQVAKWYRAMEEDMRAKKDFRLGGLSTGDKRIKPLQAADFLAYALGRYAIDYESKTNRPSVTHIFARC